MTDPGVTAPTTSPTQTAPTVSTTPIVVGAPVVPPPTVPVPPVTPIDIGAVRHPSEPLWFAVAVIAGALVLSGAIYSFISLRAYVVLIVLIVLGLVLLASTWLFIQLLRVRLLGDAVLVSQETLPQAQEVIDGVLERLDYRSTIDIFVVDKMSRVFTAVATPIVLTTLFGKHVVVMEGDLLGDLDDETDRKKLTFLLATYLGALKMRYQQWWSPALMVLQFTGVPYALVLFMLPWYRATVLSGDRVAYVCCGDLDVSIQSVYAALVGKSAAKHLRGEGMTGQALMARKRFFLRLSQLLRGTPLATNRYLHLLAFISSHDQLAFEDRRAALGSTGREVENVLSRFAGRRSWPHAPAVGIITGGLLLVAAVVFGLATPSVVLASSIQAMESGLPQFAAANDGTVTPDSSVTYEPTPTYDPYDYLGSDESYGGDQLTGEEASLAEFAPAGFDCSESVSSYATAAVTCSPSDYSSSISVSLYSFDSLSSMKQEVQLLGDASDTGACSKGQNQTTTWTESGKDKGPFVCSGAGTSGATIAWGNTSTLVSAEVTNPDWTLKRLYSWWTKGPLLE